MWAHASQTGVKVRGQLLGISSRSTVWVETDQVIGSGDKCLYSLSHLAGLCYFFKKIRVVESVEKNGVKAGGLCCFSSPGGLVLFDTGSDSVALTGFLHSMQPKLMSNLQ